MRRSIITTTVLILSLGMLSGCYDDVATTLYEPGEYKGPKDPLLAQMKTQQLQEKLDQRFNEVQTDR